MKKTNAFVNLLKMDKGFTVETIAQLPTSKLDALLITYQGVEWSMYVEIHESRINLSWNNQDLQVNEVLHAVNLVCAYFGVTPPVLRELKEWQADCPDKATELKLDVLIERYLGESVLFI